MDSKKTVISTCLGGLSKGRGRCCSNYLQEPARMTVLSPFTSITPPKNKLKNLIMPFLGSVLKGYVDRGKILQIIGEILEQDEVQMRSKYGSRQNGWCLCKVQGLNYSSQTGCLRLSYLVVINLIYSLKSCVSSDISQAFVYWQDNAVSSIL